MQWLLFVIKHSLWAASWRKATFVQKMCCEGNKTTRVKNIHRSPHACFHSLSTEASIQAWEDCCKNLLVGRYRNENMQITVCIYLSQASCQYKRSRKKEPVYFSMLKRPRVHARNGAEMAIFQLCGGSWGNCFVTQCLSDSPLKQIFFSPQIYLHQNAWSGFDCLEQVIFTSV